ncbi:translation initiation factor IF-2-like [Physeter macrocephalus]|uniref:Translation initiation factor IF-2-like n=1 Tax=Physeter macrocephalus TaxID=9755 RepID=A0A455BYJ6_PHYMC|nr:translation initiation factor IF-2-like [Physeter catodon]|eukprot:XP_028352853.1 uncharacterized protein LOC114487362 [Physeter catodon]
MYGKQGAHEVTEDQWAAWSRAWGGAWPWRRARIGTLRISLLPYKAVRGELFLEGYIRGPKRPCGAQGARGIGRVAATLAPAPGTPRRLGSGRTPASDLRLGARWSPRRPEPAPRRGERVAYRVSPFWRGRGLSGGCQGAEKKRQRRKSHTMEQNKGECAKTAAGARLARRAQSPPPAPPAPQCVPPRPAPPRPPSLLSRRRGPGWGQTRSKN